MTMRLWTNHTAVTAVAYPAAPVTERRRSIVITAHEPFGVFFARNVNLIDCTTITRDGASKLSESSADVKELRQTTSD